MLPPQPVHIYSNTNHPPPMGDYRLGKEHKLCAKIAIDRLFADRKATRAALAYPLRAVWAENQGRLRGASVQFLITVPKKRLRHAVDRVAMRRRIRESYRLLRPELVPASTPAPVDIAFLYVADKLTDYTRVHHAMKKLLRTIFPEEDLAGNPRQASSESSESCNS